MDLIEQSGPEYHRSAEATMGLAFHIASVTVARSLQARLFWTMTEACR